MSAASLPYTVLVLLVELAIGGLAMMTVFDARKQVTAGYVKAGALTVLPLAMLAAWTYLVIGRADEVQGYALASTWLRPFGIAFGAFLVIDCVHTIAAMREAHRLEVIAGTAGSVVGVAALVCLALWLGTPVWSTWGMFLSLLASAGVLGGSLMAMLWGHWYLTSGRLPKEPMEQMSIVLLGLISFQIVTVVLGVVFIPRSIPLGDGVFNGALSANPAFWLRVAVGLVFPLVVTVLAWKAATIRGMMSATGLLYVALGLLLAGEVLARGLLFTTGAAV